MELKTIGKLHGKQKVSRPVDPLLNFMYYDDSAEKYR